MNFTNALPTEAVLEYVASEKIRTCFFLSQACFYIFVLQDKGFFTLISKTIKMVCSKFEVYDSRIEELEKSIQETEMYLETFVKTYQETRDRVVKSSNRADMLETDLYMARVEKKDSDTYSRVLSKDHSKLEAEVSGLSKEIKNLKAFKLGVEDGNAFEISKIANRNFVAINKLKEENSKLRE